MVLPFDLQGGTEALTQAAADAAAAFSGAGVDVLVHNAGACLLWCLPFRRGYAQTWLCVCILHVQHVRQELTQLHHRGCSQHSTAEEAADELADAMSRLTSLVPTSNLDGLAEYCLLM